MRVDEDGLDALVWLGKPVKKFHPRHVIPYSAAEGILSVLSKAKIAAWQETWHPPPNHMIFAKPGQPGYAWWKGYVSCQMGRRFQADMQLLSTRHWRLGDAGQGVWLLRGLSRSHCWHSRRLPAAHRRPRKKSRRRCPKVLLPQRTGRAWRARKAAAIATPSSTGSGPPRATGWPCSPTRRSSPSNA